MKSFLKELALTYVILYVCILGLRNYETAHSLDTGLLYFPGFLLMFAGSTIVLILLCRIMKRLDGG